MKFFKSATCFHPVKWLMNLMRSSPHVSDMTVTVSTSGPPSLVRWECCGKKCTGLAPMMKEKLRTLPRHPRRTKSYHQPMRWAWDGREMGSSNSCELPLVELRSLISEEIVLLISDYQKVPRSGSNDCRLQTISCPVDGSTLLRSTFRLPSVKEFNMGRGCGSLKETMTYRY